MYRIGEIHRAELHGLAGHWTIHGTATVWDTRTNPGSTYLLLQLSDHPDPAIEPAHPVYVSGLLTEPHDGQPPVLDRLTTPRPGPSRIVLGPAIGRRDPADANRLVEAAHTQLAPYRRPLGTTTPIGDGYLPHLDLATQHATELGDLLASAEAYRDQLVCRMLAGKVSPGVIAAHIGKDRSRVYQIRNRASKALTA